MHAKQSAKIECAGGYFQDPETDHLLGHIDIIEYLAGTHKSCPQSKSKTPYYWHSDFRNFTLCDRCARRLKGSPDCEIASLYINLNVVYKHDK